MPLETANDRFKRGFGSEFWISLVLATLLHAAIFAGSPEFAVADYAVKRDSMIAVAPPEAPLPPPPEEVQRPAAPVIVPVAGPDVTIPPNVPLERPIDQLDPPRPRRDDARGDPIFMPPDIYPRLTNPREVQAALLRHYPPLLRDAGIGGVARVWFYIDRDGEVLETRIDRSSGYADLDQAALKVADVMAFTPAYNRDQRVPVWVSLEIRFEVR